MIKILIVDDLQTKREKIVRTILDNHDILDKNIIQAKCVKEAKKTLYTAIRLENNILVN